MPLVIETPTMASLDTELDELFDFAAASSGEPWCDPDQRLTGLPPLPYHSLLWSSGEAGDHPLKSDKIGGSLPLHDHLPEPEDFIVHGLSSPLSSQSSPFTTSHLPSSLASTPEAVFSSTTTNTLSLPDEEYQNLLDSGFHGLYDIQDDLVAFYGSSPDIISSSELPGDWSEYSPVHTDSLYSHSDFTNVAPIPVIVVDPLPSENLTIFPDDTENISSLPTLDENSTCFIAPTTNDITLSYHSTAALLGDQPIPTVSSLRRSSRTPRRIAAYHELDDSDGSLSDPPTTPTTPPPSRSLKRKSDEHDYDGWEGTSSLASSTTRSRKGGGRRSTQRRKHLSLPCGIGNCKQTFGRENDRKRHWTTAAVHEHDRPTIMESLNLPLPQSRCELCGESLSRPDARLRHERDKSCGKRAGRRRHGAQAAVTAQE